MRKIVFGLVFSLSLLLVACQTKSKDKADQSSDDSTAINTTTFKDWHSQSNAKVINPEHLSLAITVDFEKRQIRGHATWEISPEQGVEYAIFDARNLNIDSVLYASGKTEPFNTGETDSTLGTALKLKI